MEITDKEAQGIIEDLGDIKTQFNTSASILTVRRFKRLVKHRGMKLTDATEEALQLWIDQFDARDRRKTKPTKNSDD